MVAFKPSPENMNRTNAAAAADVVYPDSDGQPISDNTLQFSWIVLLKENLDAQREDFVAGDILWYPVQGRPDIRIGPDVLVAVGRPKGYRGSYKSWVEGKAPEVVFEVLSPSNSVREMSPGARQGEQPGEAPQALGAESIRKSVFYAAHGARELIIVDPDRNDGWALLFGPEGIEAEVPTLDGWSSPTLGIRFAREDGTLVVYGADGTRFIHLAEAREHAARAQAEAARAQAEAARAQAEATRAQAEATRAQAEAGREAERAERLAQKLRELGVDPEG